MSHGIKTRNEYVESLGRFYSETPKAVFAALAYSYAACFGTPANGGNETRDADEVIARLREEWDVLNLNGIVPQKVSR